MPPKRSTSKSPAPKTSKAASASPTKASPTKASPKRATSAVAVKKTSPKASPKLTAAAKKAASVASKKEDDVSSNISEEIDVGGEDAALPPMTQNQLSQNSSNNKQSPSPASRRAPSPKKASSSSVAAVKKTTAAAAATISEADKISIRQARLAATHENPKAKEATLEAVKRCNKVGVAVHSVYDYLKKKAADASKNNNNKSSSQQQQQQESVDDVLALFGPQKNSSGIGALTTQNDKLQQSIAENKGVPVTQVAVEFSFLRAPKPSRIPWSVVLPNDVHDIEKSICLITPAPQEKHRMLIEGEFGNAKDEDDFVQAPQNIQKIMDVQKLEGRFKDPVALRALAKSYSAFWVHNEVENFPRVLTGEFMSHHFPIWVNGKKSLHINERLQRTLGCVMIPRQGQDNVTVVVGHTKQSEEQLVENIRTFCGNVVALLEDSWKDVLSIRLSFKDFGSDRRIVLPIYAHDFRESHGLGSDSAVVIPKAPQVPTLARLLAKDEEKKKLKKESGKIRQREEEEVEEEASSSSPAVKKAPANSAAKSKSPAPAAKKTTSAAKTPAAPKGKKETATPTPAAKKVQEDAAVVAADDKKKTNTTKKDESDDDDDDIPEIDVAASPAPAASATKGKKPAPKGKKAGSKK